MLFQRKEILVDKTSYDEFSERYSYCVVSTVLSLSEKYEHKTCIYTHLIQEN